VVARQNLPGLKGLTTALPVESLTAFSLVFFFVSRLRSAQKPPCLSSRSSEGGSHRPGARRWRSFSPSAAVLPNHLKPSQALLRFFFLHRAWSRGQRDPGRALSTGRSREIGEEQTTRLPERAGGPQKNGCGTTEPAVAVAQVASPSGSPSSGRR